MLQQRKLFHFLIYTGKKYDLAQRVQALPLIGMGVKCEDLGRMTRFPRSALYELKKRAIERKYDPTVAPVIYNVHVEDAGRPGISLEKLQKNLAKVITYREKKWDSLYVIYLNAKLD